MSVASEYRKKSVVIKAIKWEGDNWQDLASLEADENITSYPDGTLLLETLEGKLIVKEGDWIIKVIFKKE